MLIAVAAVVLAEVQLDALPRLVDLLVGGDVARRYTLGRLLLATLGVLGFLAAVQWKRLRDRTAFLHQVNEALLLLRENEQRFRSVVEESPVGVGIVRRGIVLYANRATIRIFGQTDRSLMLGSAVLNYVAPQARAELGESVRKQEQGEIGPTS
ncbi:MAG: PAS domain S-box protein, partial [Chloroflexi bacterium]|nr:PAS domain S-box protein [Chloroflexota bacterium]